MRRVNTGDPEVLAYRGGGGGAILVGLIVMFFGIALTFASIDWGTSGVIPGVLMVFLGLLLALHRTGMEIDMRSRRWRRWWSVLVPLRTREGPVEDFERVSISREVRQSKHQTYTVYPVRLEGKKRFTLISPRSYETARREGEGFARIVKLPLADRSSGTEVVRAPEHLDESLKERVLRGGESIALPDPPAALVTRYEVEGKTLRFEIPKPRTSWRILPVFLPLVAFELIILVAFFIPLFGNAGRPGGAARIIAMAAVLILAGLLPLVVIAIVVMRRLRPSTVEASPEWLRVHTGPTGREEMVELPAGKIEEIEVRQISSGDRGIVAFLDGGAPITVRSDERTLTFGGHLPADEKQWMVQVLKQVLTA